MKARESATADEKTALQTKISDYEAQVKVQEALKAEADREVTRVKEAKENAEKLATLAQEIADAKENTDAIVADLQDARDILTDTI